MNKFKYYFVLLLAGVALVSCHKADDDVVPLRDYSVQYKADNDSIVKYLKTNYIEVDTQTYDVKITKIPAGGTQTSIWDQTVYPLQTRAVYSNNVNYTVYYLSLRKGTGLSPTNTDKISAAYVGTLLDGTVFDQSYNLPRALYLYENEGSTAPAIDGWGEILPQFKTGTSQTAGNGNVTYDNFGAGVMFVPSGLAYYGGGAATIPVYTPVVFSFKLYDLQRLDHDIDGVFDYDEDINHDGYMYDFTSAAGLIKYPNPPASLIDDTDKDGVPDFLDVDDDGDGWTTFFEVTKPTGAPVSGISTFYPFDPVMDNPNTPNFDETETYGIPRRFTGPLVDPTKPESATNVRTGLPEDYTDPARLRLHLDKNNHTGTGY